jgi:hypothetical protein
MINSNKQAIEKISLTADGRWLLGTAKMRGCGRRKAGGSMPMAKMLMRKKKKKKKKKKKMMMV